MPNKKINYKHDPSCSCDPNYFCASIPAKWCSNCGHAKSQHMRDTGECCACDCESYKDKIDED